MQIYIRRFVLLKNKMNISVESIHKILKENKYHPFKLTFVQHLRPTRHEV